MGHPWAISHSSLIISLLGSSQGCLLHVCGCGVKCIRPTFPCCGWAGNTVIEMVNIHTSPVCSHPALKLSEWLWSFSQQECSVLLVQNVDISACICLAPPFNWVLSFYPNPTWAFMLSFLKYSYSLGSYLPVFYSPPFLSILYSIIRWIFF